MAEVLGPDERSEIDRLQRALALGKGPEFHMIVGDTRRVVDAALAEVLPGVTVPRETVAPAQEPKAFAVRWMRWLEAAIHEGGAQPLVLDAWDVDPEHTEHWAWIFGRLNERRNEIMRGLGRPLLLTISPDNERLLGRTAPDLWSIRGVGMRLHDRGRVTTNRRLLGAERPPAARPAAPTQLAQQQQRVERARVGAARIVHAIEAIRLSQGLHEAQRDAEALVFANEAIAEYESLARDDDEKLIDLARALRARAEIAAAMGQRQAALEDLRRSTSIAVELIRQQPSRADLQQDLRLDHVALGDLHIALGKEDLAQGYYARAEAIGTWHEALEPADHGRAEPGPHVPSVFISYSHDSAAHAARVLALADRLRGEGVDARLDQYVAVPLEGWPAWTQRQLAAVDFVVLICTATYRQRFEDDASNALEAVVARQLFYESNDRKHGLLPVVLEGSTEEDIPRPLRAYTAYVLPKDYDGLLRRLTRLSAPVT